MGMYREQLECHNCREDLECRNCGSGIVQVTVQEGYPDGSTQTEVYLEVNSGE